MIPLRDASRRPVHFPKFTVLIIGINVVVFILELFGGTDFIMRWALIPADVLAGHHWITILTSMFLHGSLLHVAGNMWFLWVFGSEIEDVMSSGRYPAFYLLGGLVAMIAQMIIGPSSKVPNLGASGAIAAVMGVFLITYPRDRIRTLFFIVFFVRIISIPAAFLVGLWFLIQVFNQVGALAQTETGGVAYMAHISGFIFGMVFGRFFEDRGPLAQKRLEV